MRHLIEVFSCVSTMQFLKEKRIEVLIEGRLKSVDNSSVNHRKMNINNGLRLTEGVDNS